MKQKYGKLVGGALRLHGPDFPIENKKGGVTVTTDRVLLTASGFRPVTENPAQPPEGYVPAGFVWEENEAGICRRWNYVPAEDGAPTVEERLEAVELLLLEMLGVEI